MEKVFKWLGFIQGVLWIMGVYTVEELKDHNTDRENAVYKRKMSL